MKTARTLVLAGIVLLAAAPAHAHELFFRTGALWVTDPSYDLFAEQDAFPLVLLGGGLALDEAVSVELAWGFTGANATAFETVDTSFFLHQVQGALRWDLVGAGTFRTALRGAANFLVGQAQLDDGVAALESTALGLGLDGTVLGEVHVPMGTRGATFAFSAEAGWGFNALPLDFGKARVDGGGTEQPGIALGKLNVSGPILRFGVGMHF